MTRTLPLRIARNIVFQHHPTMTACWIWTGRKTRRPGQTRAKGFLLPVEVRSEVYHLLKGESQLLKNLCGEDLCVNPHHMKSRS